MTCPRLPTEEVVIPKLMQSATTFSAIPWELEIGQSENIYTVDINQHMLQITLFFPKKANCEHLPAHR